MIFRWTITLTYPLRNPRCSCSGFLPRHSRHWSEPWGRWRRKFWPWARCAPAKDKPTPPSRCAPSTSYESETEKSVTFAPVIRLMCLSFCLLKPAFARLQKQSPHCQCVYHSCLWMLDTALFVTLLQSFFCC